MRPLLLVDIDGVLNPYAAPLCPADYEELDLGYEEPVRIRRAHGAWLTELSDHFEPVWATGWGGEANEVMSPLLELPPWPVVQFPRVPFEPHEKVPAIAAYVGGRPAAWIDDAHTDDGRSWAEGRTVPTLLVPADPAVGLTRDHVDGLLAWAAGLAA